MNSTSATQYLLALRQEIGQFWKATDRHIATPDAAYIPYAIPEKLTRFLETYVEAVKKDPQLAATEIVRELLKLECAVERCALKWNCSAPRGYETIEAMYKANPAIATADLCVAIFRRGPLERPFNALAKLIGFNPTVASAHIADCLRKCIGRKETPYDTRSTAFELFNLLQDNRPDLFAPLGPVRPIRAPPKTKANSLGLNS